MDVWVEIEPANADKIVAALKEFGFELPELSAELFLIPEKIIRMGEPPIRIEIVTSISGVTFEDCYASRVIDELDGVPVSLIGFIDLKGNKKASGKYKDHDDLENLP
jgi:hypothetical protein